MTAIEKTEMALSLTRDILRFEEVLKAKREELSRLFDPTEETSMTVSAMLDESIPTRHVESESDEPLSTRVKKVLDSEPGKRFHIDEIRAAIGTDADKHILAFRKALFRISQTKGYGRDKRGRGLYYAKAE
jgi:hypothetical protein